MPDASALTAADIARLAGVTRATVSNWRRRHPDFPEPSGGTATSPAYDRTEVEAWLAVRGALPEIRPAERLWRDVLEIAGGGDLGDAVLQAVELVQATPDPEPDPTTPHAVRTVKNRPRRERVARDLADIAAQCGSAEALGMLTGKYLEATGRQAFATPKPVADLMARLAVTGRAVVLDPACGTGELLASAVDSGATSVVGQDIDKGLARLAGARLRVMAGPGAVRVLNGDSLSDDQAAGLLADVVLCHPPFGDRDWDHDELAYDPRWEYGLPPRAEPELAWVQHALAHLRPGGHAVMLMPPAAASRSSGRRIRAEMLRRGAIRAIAALPSGAVQPRNIGLHLWVLARPAADAARDPRMLFIDAAAPSDEAGRARRVQDDWQQASAAILQAWTSHTEAAPVKASGAWREVPVIDLLDDEVDLTPSRHTATAFAARPAPEIAAAAGAARARLHGILDGLSEALPGREWTPAGAHPEWRMVSIGELARSGSVSVHRASAAAPADHQLADGPPAHGRQPVLTLSDVASGEAPSATAQGSVTDPGWITIRCGDVIIPAAAGGPVTARVATSQDDTAILGRGLHLIRADSERMDPWFLAGFLASPANIQQASYGSTVTRIDVRRLMVPLVPPRDQGRYGAAFRELHGFRVSCEEFARMSGTLTGLLGRALAQGGLLPGPDSRDDPGKPGGSSPRLDRDDISRNGKRRR